MKKIIQKALVLSSAFLLLFQAASAQKADTSTVTQAASMHDIYLQKHRNFNTAGFVMLGSGGTALIIGTAILTSQSGKLLTFSDAYNEHTANAGAVLFAVGGTLMLGSIPCFIIAANNKKKAILELKSGNTMGPGSFSYAGVGLKVKF